MARFCRSWLVGVGLLLVLAVGCAPGPSGVTVSATPAMTPTVPQTPTPMAVLDFLGQFDCYGLEAGTRAYAGRITLEPEGAVTFGDQNGQWSYAAETATFSFTGSINLGEATYQASDDTLVAEVRSGSAVAHAEDGRLDCVRAQPGITGP